MNNSQELQQWISFDNELKILNEKVKQIRIKKYELEKKILTQYPINSSIKVGDGMLKIVNTRTSTPLTFKYLEKSLGEIIKNDAQVTQIIGYIKSQREIHVISEIKRLMR